MRIVFVLCEGPHDVAFLSRLLSSEGYSYYKNKVSDFPFPLGDWMVNSAKKLSIQDLNVDKVYKDLSCVLPNGAMVNSEREHLILLYSMNGDSRKEERMTIINKLKKWTSAPENEKEFSILEESDEGNDYGLLILYDADDKGIDTRIAEIKNDIRGIFPIVDSIDRNGGVAAAENKFKIGVYIFADNKTGRGTLENILLPIMKGGDETIFDEAEEFLDKHKNEERLKPLVFKKNESGKIVEERKKKNKYHQIKSILGVVGQLQNSGTSNTVCIEKADYINLNKIKSSPICQEIIKMFESL